MVGLFNLAKILPDERYLRQYYRYGGSLTTPPCTSGLVWTVFEHKIPISHRQVTFAFAFQLLNEFFPFL